MEMLTGRPVFPGSTDSGLLSAVQSSEPDWAMLPADTPEPIRSLLRQCLEKDRARRLDSAGAVRLQIDEVLAAAAARTAGVVPSRRVALATMAALSLVLAASIAWIPARSASETPATPVRTRWPIVTPLAQPLNADSPGRDLALSPDGRHLVYRFGGSATTGAPLAVRPLGSIDARALAGTGHAYAPFFSFDGLWIGFFENDELKKVSIDGGPVVTLCAVIGQPRGASWGDDNTIVFATDHPAMGLWRVPATGGKPIVLTTPETTQPGNDHFFPSVLPGGNGVLFTVAAEGSPDTAQLAALDLKTGRWERLGRTGNQPEYVDRVSGRSGEGFLVYAAAGALHAERFDPVRRTPLGKPATVEEHVMTKSSGAANYAVSRQGTLVFMPAREADEVSKRTLVWVDRSGLETPINAPPRAYGPSRISPDGTRVAVGIDDSGNSDIWILDLATGKMTRLTDKPGIDALPIWTPDGRIVFTSDRDGKGVPNLYIVNADGLPPVVSRLTTSASKQWATSIDRNRNLILSHQFVRPAMTITTMAVDLSAGRPPEDLFRGNFAEISPNSRYLTYRSGESGIVVRSYTSTNQVWQVATGTRSMWSRSGDELFYLDQSAALTVMPANTSGSTFSYGRATKLFDTASRYVESKSNPSRHYDVSPDGSRFLMIKEPAPDPYVTPANLVVVQPWTEVLKERVR
jgi:serine/threonine-protein kinase